MDSIEDNQKIGEFRKLLKNIKQTILNKLTYSTQNTSALNKVEHRLIQFYTVLKPAVFHGTPVKIKEIQELFDDVLNTNKFPRSSYYQNQLEYYLHRDFIEYPFTIDEDDIDEDMKYKSYGEPIIIENNMSLTDSNE